MKRMLCSCLCAFLVALASAGPVGAEAPTAAPSEEVDPLTPEEQKIAAQKLAIAKKEIAHPGYVQGLRTRAVCPLSASALADMSPMSFCTGYYGGVGTTPRLQETPYYCGVATVQVVSNYAWGMASTANKYAQTYIATNWTKTTTAGTTTTGEINGLNKAVGSKLPAGFVYSGVWHGGKLTGPLTGAEWHGYLRTDLSSMYKMPQVVSVSPMDKKLSFGLSSWARAGAPKQDAGHWIVIFMWEGVWDGTVEPIVGYDDSAIRPTGMKDYDPALNIYAMIKQYNPNHGTNGVVW